MILIILSHNSISLNEIISWKMTCETISVIQLYECYKIFMPNIPTKKNAFDCVFVCVVSADDCLCIHACENNFNFFNIVCSL